MTKDTLLETAANHSTSKQLCYEVQSANLNISH